MKKMKKICAIVLDWTVVQSIVWNKLYRGGDGISLYFAVTAEELVPE